MHVSEGCQWVRVCEWASAARLNFGGARGLPAECLRARQGANLSMRLSLFFHLRFCSELLCTQSPKWCAGRRRRPPCAKKVRSILTGPGSSVFPKIQLKTLPKGETPRVSALRTTIFAAVAAHRIGSGSGFEGCLGKSKGCQNPHNQQFGPRKKNIACILASPEDPCNAMFLQFFDHFSCVHRVV